MAQYRCRFLNTGDESQNLGFFWTVTLELDWDAATVTLSGRRMDQDFYSCLWNGLDDPVSGCGFYASWLGYVPYVLLMVLSGVILPVSVLHFEKPPDPWVRRAGGVLEFSVRDPRTHEDQLLQIVFKSSTEATQVARMLKLKRAAG